MLHDGSNALSIRNAYAFCEQEMRFQFFERALRYAQVLNERPRMFPAMSLRDVGGNGCRRSPYLCGEAEQFVAWKFSCQPIAGFGESHGILPHSQIAVRCDRRIAQNASLFATRYSPFAYFFASGFMM